MKTERRYTYGGRFAHLLPYATDYADYPYTPAFCGYSPRLFVAWLGSGSQDEEDRANALPTCPRCLKLSDD